MDKFKCGICAKALKSEAGLVGHMRLTHDEGKIKTYPDKIGERLANLEAIASAGINPGKVVDSKEKVIDKLRLLLPAVEKYGLAVCSIDKLDEDSFLTKYIKEYRIINNSDISGGIGTLRVKTGAEVY